MMAGAGAIVISASHNEVFNDRDRRYAIIESRPKLTKDRHAREHRSRGKSKQKKDWEF